MLQEKKLDIPLLTVFYRFENSVSSGTQFNIEMYLGTGVKICLATIVGHESRLFDQ